ncbi:MAG: phosphate signaling complex protein PhoU [Deltaproteobacteria bacterium]|jgi:phosphate transport system protein|nr:phosphate signaling complex protein PhoU [Deltaproteobacteria bacterium]
MNGEEKETRLQQELAHLRARLLLMCATVSEAVAEVCAAMDDEDGRRAEAVIAGEAEVDALENEIDALIFSLLVRNQPVAQDLRFVVASLRLVIDLERIGDEAASIAGRLLAPSGLLPAPLREGIRPLADMAADFYRKAVEAFRAGNAELALELSRSDDRSAKMEEEATQRVMDYIVSADKDAEQPRAEMRAILICRSLSRICRRAANMGAHTYFIAWGINLKHA